MEITVVKTSPIGITPERQDYSCLPARDQHEQESKGPARAGDKREGGWGEEDQPSALLVTPKGPASGWGSAESHPGEAGGTELVLESHSQRADGNSC